METHRKLMVFGAILLAGTLALDHYDYEIPGIQVSYAYVTGVGMLVCFAASLVMFTKDKI